MEFLSCKHILDPSSFGVTHEAPAHWCQTRFESSVVSTKQAILALPGRSIADYKAS